METRGTFSQAQVQQLLAPIKPNRVLQAQGHSHVSQQDIQAHLIRMFGFGNFDIEILDVSLIFEEPRVDPKTGEATGRWDVSYRALVRLTVRNEDGVTVAMFENGSTGDAQNQTRAGGHDLAYKSAISLSIKRAAISLGDQFGLSLYNKGQLDPIVRQTLIGVESVVADVQDGVPQQVSLGNDEIDLTPAETIPAPTDFKDWVDSATNMGQLTELFEKAKTEGYWSHEIQSMLTKRKNEIASAE